MARAPANGTEPGRAESRETDKIRWILFLVSIFLSPSTISRDIFAINLFWYYMIIGSG